MRHRPLALALLSSSALLLAHPMPAAAAVHLAVGDCGGAGYRAWTCTSNTGLAVVLVGSIDMPALPSLVRADCIVDFGFPAAGLRVPDWWRIGVGLCRSAGNLDVRHTDDLGGMSCLDHFGSFATPSTTTHRYEIGPADADADPFGSIPATHARLYVSTSLDPSMVAEAGAPAPGDEVHLFTIAVARPRTVGTDACEGCGSGVCVTFLQATLAQRGGPSHVARFDDDWRSGWVELQASAPGTDACYYVIPDAASRSTWGQVKALYR